MTTHDFLVGIGTAVALSVGYLGGIVCFHEIRMRLEDRRARKDFEMRRAQMLAELEASARNRRQPS